MADTSMIKGGAVLAQDPGRPPLLRVARHLTLWRERYPGYAGDLDAAAVLERGGGPAAFPYADTMDRVVGARLRQTAQRSTRNDVFDEYIASYAPYVPATVVDRPTYNRAREGRVPALGRMTADATAVAGILDRVAAGELVVVPSASPVS